MNNVAIGGTTPLAGKFTTLQATGVTTVQAGTLSDPAITTTGDTNTGIFFPAADTIAFTEGGVESMRITSAGDVGIGTSSPTTFGGFKSLELANSSGNAISLVTGTSVIAQTISSSTNSLVYTGTRSNHSLVFTTNDTERARLNTTGAFVLAGGTVTANGIGITFPASQSASSDVNTLDDYEEGTWTPSQGAGLTVVGTFSSSGKYTKIGRQVTVYGVLLSTTTVAWAGTNSQIVTGLPFTSDGDFPGTSMNGSRTQGAIIETSSSALYAAQAMSATSAITICVTYFV
jgi:hypothetical protein